MIPEEIASDWQYQTEIAIGLDSVNSVSLYDFNPNEEPASFEPYMVPIATNFMDTIYVNLHDGKVVEAMDGDCGTWTKTKNQTAI